MVVVAAVAVAQTEPAPSSASRSLPSSHKACSLTGGIHAKSIDIIEGEPFAYGLSLFEFLIGFALQKAAPKRHDGLCNPKRKA